MLDHNHGVAFVHEPMQHVEKQLNVGHMQANGGFLQQIQCRSRLAHFSNPLVCRAADPAFQLRYQLEPLRFSAAQRRARLPQFKVAEPSIDQQGERASNFRMR